MLGRSSGEVQREILKNEYSFWKNGRFVCWNFEVEAVQKSVNLIDLAKSFHTSTCLQKSASIQPRTSLSKFGVDFIHLLSSHLPPYRLVASRVLPVRSRPEYIPRSRPEYLHCNYRTAFSRSQNPRWTRKFHTRLQKFRSTAKQPEYAARRSEHTLSGIDSPE